MKLSRLYLEGKHVSAKLQVEVVHLVRASGESQRREEDGQSAHLPQQRAQQRSWGSDSRTDRQPLPRPEQRLGVGAFL